MLLDYINKLQNVYGLSKHERLVNGIVDAINDGYLKKGDQLPSINKMVSELRYARKTIVKAYEELKSRGLVESKSFLGYYICSEDTDTTLKVALLLFAFHSYQEKFYNTFREVLGESIKLDLFFHHSNKDIFSSIVENIKDKYGFYVIAPIDKHETFDLLNVLPADKLLLVDRFISEDNPYSFIAQEFEKSSYNALNNLRSELNKYEQFILCFKKNSDYPVGILKSFKRFNESIKLNTRIDDVYRPGSVEKGDCLFVINDHELWELIKDCNEKGLSVGSDVGIISHNDAVIKEIICDGITTHSTDFAKMAIEAAKHVLNPVFVQKIIASDLRIRNSV